MLLSHAAASADGDDDHDDNNNSCFLSFLSGEERKE
jgi:hypothetical protein